MSSRVSLMRVPRMKVYKGKMRELGTTLKTMVWIKAVILALRVGR